MRRRSLFLRIIGIALLLGIAPRPASAHCDSMDGPVVQAARKALAMGTVAPALAWVRPEDEAEIQDAFARTLAVRAAGGLAAELADRWFFENLVRVHRLGEGEPYTGLKPSGTEVPAGIAAAERALETRSVVELESQLAAGVTHALHARFERAIAASDHDPADVAAGRRYVAAYSEFIHFAEEILQRSEASEHPDPAAGVAAHDH